ncbi:MAG: RidA family protein [Egibacteraceae bacterium]
MTIEERLAALGITLPAPPPAAAAYVPWTRSGDLVFTAGQLPLDHGELVARGVLGDGLDLPTGRRCARACAVNLLAQMRAAAGDLAQVRRVIKVTVFVASAPAFTDQHLVANGCSELLAEVLGEAGRHARAAVGVACLPMGAPVEAEAVVEVASG